MSYNSWWASWKKSLEKVTSVSVVLWDEGYAILEIVWEEGYYVLERERNGGKGRKRTLYT
jgi:hypothetical protein